MASGAKLFVYADFVSKYNSLKSFRITKILNNGRNNLILSSSNYGTSTETLPKEQDVEKSAGEGRINKAVQNYLQRAKDYDNFIQEQVKEFEKGKRFLARIMGKDSKTFTQEQIDEAIEYLFPSALHEPLARPMFKHPDLLYEKRKEAQFDKTGRPYHYLFYTTKPNFCQALHECSQTLHNLNEKMRQLGPNATHPKLPINVIGSLWLKKPELEAMLLENLLDVEYEKFIQAMERLVAHPYSFDAAPFIMRFRKNKTGTDSEFKKPPIRQIADNVFAVEVEGCRRKTCRGKVKLVNPGTGKLSINGKSLIDFFEDLQPRQEVGRLV